MSFSKLYVGESAGSFTFADKKDAITGVRVFLTDDTAVFEGTEDSILEVYIPLCTSTAEASTFAQGILSALSGWNYQPFDAGDILADPAAQIGDGITVRGVYSAIYKKTTRLGVQTTQDASAPCEEEVNHEFPWVSGEERKDERKYTDFKDTVESELNVQAGLISAKVSKLSPTGQTSFSWAMNDSSHIWYANGTQVMKISSAGLVVNGSGTFSGTITATAGEIGGCSIVNGVLQVNSANVKSLAIGSNFSVDTSGNMTANNATITGTLSVGGSLITAANLYTGASQAAASYGGWNSAYTSTQSGGYCYGGASYGYGYGNATTAGTVSYPANFKCGHMYAASGAQVGPYSLGTQNITYLDGNGVAKTVRFWTAQT